MTKVKSLLESGENEIRAEEIAESLARLNRIRERLSALGMSPEEIAEIINV